MKYLGIAFFLLIYSCSKDSTPSNARLVSPDHLTKHIWVLDSAVEIKNNVRYTEKPGTGERLTVIYSNNSYSVVINNDPPLTKNYLFKSQDTVFYWNIGSQMKKDTYIIIKQLTEKRFDTYEKDPVTSIVNELYMHAE